MPKSAAVQFPQLSESCILEFLEASTPPTFREWRGTESRRNNVVNLRVSPLEGVVESVVKRLGARHRSQSEPLTARAMAALIASCPCKRHQERHQALVAKHGHNELKISPTGRAKIAHALLDYKAGRAGLGWVVVAVQDALSHHLRTKMGRTAFGAKPERTLAAIFNVEVADRDPRVLVGHRLIRGAWAGHSVAIDWALGVPDASVGSYLVGLRDAALAGWLPAELDDLAAVTRVQLEAADGERWARFQAEIRGTREISVADVALLSNSGWSTCPTATVATDAVVGKVCAVHRSRNCCGSWTDPIAGLDPEDAAARERQVGELAKALTGAVQGKKRIAAAWLLGLPEADVVLARAAVGLTSGMRGLLKAVGARGDMLPEERAELVPGTVALLGAVRVFLQAVAAEAALADGEEDEAGHTYGAEVRELFELARSVVGLGPSETAPLPAAGN